MSYHIAFQMDALEDLSKPGDSTLYLARTAAERGYPLFHYQPQHLRMMITDRGTRIEACGHVLKYNAQQSDPWELGEKSVRSLSDFDVILMRQDPPFDLSYITATHILEHVPKKTKIINDPVGVRNAPEKLLTTYFPQFMPPTLIARDRDAIEAFRTEHKDIIIKPLHGFAGHGIFHLREEDDNLVSLIEMMGSTNNEPWMIQKFLPVATLGDKRIVLLDGKPVGVFTRFPIKGDMRGNMRVGGRPEAAPLTKRDIEICETIAPTLRKMGLFLTGIDVIGDCLTEINVTSPTGLLIADKLAGKTGKETISEAFWNQALA